MADKNNQTEEVVKKNETKVEKTKAPKKDKVPFTKKIGTFFRENRAELKKIVWYSRSQTVKTTIVVLVCMVICSAAISLLDFGFASVISFLSGRL